MDDLLESIKETAIKVLIDCIKDKVDFVPRVLIQVEKTIHLILLPLNEDSEIKNEWFVALGYQIGALQSHRFVLISDSYVNNNNEEIFEALIINLVDFKNSKNNTSLVVPYIKEIDTVTIVDEFEHPYNLINTIKNLIAFGFIRYQSHEFCQRKEIFTEKQQEQSKDDFVEYMNTEYPSINK